MDIFLHFNDCLLTTSASPCAVNECSQYGGSLVGGLWWEASGGGLQWEASSGGPLVGDSSRRLLFVWGLWWEGHQLDFDVIYMEHFFDIWPLDIYVQVSLAKVDQLSRRPNALGKFLVCVI